MGRLLEIRGMGVGQILMENTPRSMISKPAELPGKDSGGRMDTQS